MAAAADPDGEEIKGEGMSGEVDVRGSEKLAIDEQEEEAGDGIDIERKGGDGIDPREQVEENIGEEETGPTGEDPGRLMMRKKRDAIITGIDKGEIGSEEEDDGSKKGDIENGCERGNKGGEKEKSETPLGEKDPETRDREKRRTFGFVSPCHPADLFYIHAKYISRYILI